MSETEDERLNRLARDKFVRQLPKRFYKSVSVGADNEILLDGRSVKTPLKAVLRLPTSQLAKAVAAEWEAQINEINPHAMPLTKLANTAIDRAVPHLGEIRADILAYAANDLLCYRAGEPAALVARQVAAWDPPLKWAEECLGARFTLTNGLAHINQPPDCSAAMARWLKGLDPFAMVAVHTMTTLSGSAVLAAMVAQGALTADAAWAATSLGEAFQAELWGRDAEAEARDKARAAEFTHSAEFINLAR